jgi:hypothetical protein
MFLLLHSAIFILHNRVQKEIMRIIKCNELEQLNELNNLYLDNEFNNLQTIATHERFVEGVEVE